MSRACPASPDEAGWSLPLVAWLLVASVPVIARLARARLDLRQVVGTDILARNSKVAGLRTADQGFAGDGVLASRIAWLLPRLARRVPWRADCLVQAMAAQGWLAARGIASTIVIGVDTQGRQGFEPHAWLHHGDRIITGGSVDRYTPLVGGS